MKFLDCPLKQIYYMSIVMLHIEHVLRSYIFITGIIKLPILGIKQMQMYDKIDRFPLDGALGLSW